jgi:hypothetical protein
MEAVNVHIGPLVFDHADYDAEGDVLYLHVGELAEGEGEEAPEAVAASLVARSREIRNGSLTAVCPHPRRTGHPSGEP